METSKAAVIVAGTAGMHSALRESAGKMKISR